MRVICACSQSAASSINRVCNTVGLEQVELLREAWPSTREELESDLRPWFLIAAPAGIVWVLDNGELCWT
ncbi:MULTISPECIES: DUF596 domain-containing protein [Stenotrophomonas]|uniref:DUF596 domain-containing protein n=1 Tax=Stenotrophomonas TaxID=40323 RepID=UPI001EE3FA20|nr:MULTISPECIES: DUF596 domain-containing protein [Stenotrophomonas]